MDYFLHRFFLVQKNGDEGIIADIVLKNAVRTIVRTTRNAVYRVVVAADDSFAAGTFF